MTPEKMLKKTENYYSELQKAKALSVAVGLPKEKIGGKIYGDGNSIIKIGAIHEYGRLDKSIPSRSFLRAPFHIKSREIQDAIADQFRQVAENDRKAERALGLIGVEAANISKEAFVTKGYGTWPDLKPETKRRKGSSQPLIDTGTLRRSITWVVR